MLVVYDGHWARTYLLFIYGYKCFIKCENPLRHEKKILFLPHPQLARDSGRFRIDSCSESTTKPECRRFRPDYYSFLAYISKITRARFSKKT
jgi:hypothetical protein